MDSKEALNVAECVVDGAYKVLDNDPDEVFDAVIAAAEKDMHPLAAAVVKAVVEMQRHDRDAVRKLQEDLGEDSIAVTDQSPYLGLCPEYKDTLEFLASLGKRPSEDE